MGGKTVPLTQPVRFVASGVLQDSTAVEVLLPPSVPSTATPAPMTVTAAEASGTAPGTEEMELSEPVSHHQADSAARASGNAGLEEEFVLLPEASEMALESEEKLLEVYTDALPSTAGLGFSGPTPQPDGVPLYDRSVPSRTLSTN